MASFSSSRILPLPHSTTRRSHVSEAPTTYTSSIRFYANNSVVSEPSPATLLGAVRETTFDAWARRDAMISDMDRHAGLPLSPTHPRAEVENVTLPHFNEYFSQYTGNNINNNNVDPGLYQHNTPPNYAGNNIHVYEDNLPNPAGDIYDNDIDPIYDQENVLPSHPSNYVNGHAEGHFSNYASNDIHGYDIGPRFERESVYPDPTGNAVYRNDIYPGHQQEYAYPGPSGNNNYSNAIYHGNEQEDVYPDPYGNYIYDNAMFPDDEQENFTGHAANHHYNNIIIPDVIAPIQESLLNSAPYFLPFLLEEDPLEEPEMKIEPVDEDYFHTVLNPPIPSGGPVAQELDIRESIESDGYEVYYYPPEMIQPIKRERSPIPTIHNHDSMESHCPARTSFNSYTDPHGVIARYF
ncbi:hypothetical protein F4859DRAFT_515050 [Xylaria cf. heliscus]|nr:hypothetical protein F4859DRAFT_515050 [Xylaria cf. heliscus]